MSYEVPTVLKDRLLFGDLSDKIDVAINNYSSIFKKYHEFDSFTIDQINIIFKGYVCYKYLLHDDEISQYLFLRTINSTEPEIRLYPLINDFIVTFIQSYKSDSNIKDDLSDFKREYLKILSNITSPKFAELSKKDKEYKKYIEKNLIHFEIDIDPNVLLMLTKCVIIEKNNNDDIFFNDVNDAVVYAMELYYKQTITFEEKKGAVLEEQRVLQSVSRILEENDFVR